MVYGKYSQSGLRVFTYLSFARSFGCGVRSSFLPYVSAHFHHARTHSDGHGTIIRMLVPFALFHRCINSQIAPARYCLQSFAYRCNPLLLVRLAVRAKYRLLIE